MSGSVCISKVFLNVCCASSFGMMIQTNGIFELIGGTTSMEPIDYMGVC
jgi:hypothetical protein